jgi:hypothetical protein
MSRSSYKICFNNNKPPDVQNIGRLCFSQPWNFFLTQMVKPFIKKIDSLI